MLLLSGAPLCIEDVSVLGMEVQSSWTGAAVADFIRRNMRLQYRSQPELCHLRPGHQFIGGIEVFGLVFTSDRSHVMMNPPKRCLKTMRH
ncbi:MAG: hypothetical protein H6573_25605 [Lewinellaceae bacterium]|nr:hypothetical protein [Lewinellaceae bacterium]